MRRRTVKEKRREYYKKPIQRDHVYFATKKEGWKFGRNSAEKSGEFGNVYFLSDVKLVKPIQLNPTGLGGVRKLYELVFKKRKHPKYPWE